MKEKKGTKVEAKVSLSKKLPPILGDSQIEFANYHLRSIPSSILEKSEGIIQFYDRYIESTGHGSHPVGEADIVIKLLSLFFGTDIDREGVTLNSVDVPAEFLNPRNQYPHFQGTAELDGLDKYFERVLSLNEDLAKQFIRACNTYSVALNFIPSDPTFAFFLLVVSVECLSSQSAIISSDEMNIDGKKCERFCNFVMTYLPEAKKGEDECNEVLFKELLKTAYYVHRSAFVHAGKEVSKAAIMADKVNSSYFKHMTGDSETKTPGLKWFSGVTRGALLGWIQSLPPPSNEKMDKELFAKLAFEKVGLRMKAKRDVKEGEVVSFADVEFR